MFIVCVCIVCCVFLHCLNWVVLLCLCFVMFDCVVSMCLSGCCCCDCYLICVVFLFDYNCCDCVCVVV